MSESLKPGQSFLVGGRPADFRKMRSPPKPPSEKENKIRENVFGEDLGGIVASSPTRRDQKPPEKPSSLSLRDERGLGGLALQGFSRDRVSMNGQITSMGVLQELPGSPPAKIGQAAKGSGDLHRLDTEISPRVFELRGPVGGGSQPTLSLSTRHKKSLSEFLGLNRLATHPNNLTTESIEVIGRLGGGSRPNSPGNQAAPTDRSGSLSNTLRTDRSTKFKTLDLPSVTMDESPLTFVAALQNEMEVLGRYVQKLVLSMDSRIMDPKNVGRDVYKIQKRTGVVIEGAKMEIKKISATLEQLGLENRQLREANRILKEEAQRKDVDSQHHLERIRELGKQLEDHKRDFDQRLGVAMANIDRDKVRKEKNSQMTSMEIVREKQANVKLAAALQELTAEIGDKKSEIYKHLSHIKVLEATVADLKAENGKLERKMEKIGTEKGESVQELSLKLADLRREIQELRTRASRETDEAAQLIRTLEAEKKDLESQVAETQKFVSVQRHQAAETETDLRAAVKRLKDERETLEHANHQLVSDVAFYQKMVQEVEADLVWIRDTKESNKAHSKIEPNSKGSVLREVVREFGILKEECLGLKKCVKMKEQELEKALYDAKMEAEFYLEGEKSLVARLQADLRAKEEQLALLSDNFDQLKQEKCKSEVSCSDLSGEVEGLRAQLLQTKEELMRLQQREFKSQALTEELTARLANQEKKFSLSKEKIAKLVEDKRELSIKVSTLSLRLEKAESVVERPTRKEGILSFSLGEGVSGRREETLGPLSEQISELREKNQNLTKKLIESEKTHTEKDQVIARNSEELRGYQEEIDSLQTKLKRLENQFELKIASLEREAERDRAELTKRLEFQHVQAVQEIKLAGSRLAAEVERLANQNEHLQRAVVGARESAREEAKLETVELVRRIDQLMDNERHLLSSRKEVQKTLELERRRHLEAIEDLKTLFRASSDQRGALVLPTQPSMYKSKDTIREGDSETPQSDDTMKIGSNEVGCMVKNLSDTSLGLVCEQNQPMAPEDGDHGLQWI